MSSDLGRSLLVILRDQGLPLPAGAILISPWVDLTHSFPSVAGDNNFDYIPSHGFLQKPSAAWPPPNAEDMEEIAIHAVEQVVDQSLPRKSSQQARKKAEREAVQGFSTNHNPESLHAKANDDNSAGLEGAGVRPGNTIPGPGHDLSIMIDDNFIEIKDQIQMYATNQLISHPLVSPALQPSLGGLPPLLILTGGGEVLRDEQIYVAHKAASPSKYPPGDFYFDEYPEARDVVAKWKPTDVQLQVWDDLCHVAPTLSFTRPAKFMFRSIAQFGAWALARAQKTEIEIQDDDDISVISSGSDTGTDTSSGLGKPKKEMTTTQNGVAQGGGLPAEKVGKAGDPLPPFRNHMIRQKVDRHGIIYPLGPTSSLPALQMRANDIGVIKPGPVRKWMAAKKEWDTKYAREKQKVQKQRVKEMAKGYQGFGNDEVPPPSALAGRRGVNMPKEKKKGHSWGMSLWSRWGSSHDEKTVSDSRCRKALKLMSSRLSARRRQIKNRRPLPPQLVMAFPQVVFLALQVPNNLVPDLVTAPSPMQAKPTTIRRTSTKILLQPKSFVDEESRLMVKIYNYQIAITFLRHSSHCVVPLARPLQRVGRVSTEKNLIRVQRTMVDLQVVVWHIRSSSGIS